MLSVDDVLDLLAIPLIGIIPEDESVIIASNRGTPLAFEKNSRVGLAFMNIARRLMGEEIQLAQLENQGFLQRLFSGRK